MAPHQWIKCLGQKGKELDSVPKNVKSRSSRSLLAEEKHFPSTPRSLALAGLPHHAGLFRNGPVPWPHERCSGTMSKPSHYIEPRHQFRGWVTGASPLCVLSLLREDGPSHSCHLTTPRGIPPASRRRVVRTIPTPLCKAKSLVSHFVPLWYAGAWSMSHYGYEIRNSEW